MKKTFKLTNDHVSLPNGFSDAYYCEFPHSRNFGFRLCVDEMNKLFPHTKGKETITLTISTVKQKKAGEVAVKYIPMSYEMPYVYVKGNRIMILEQTRNNSGIPLKSGDTVFVIVA